MQDSLDVSLHDDELSAEVELMANLMVAASRAHGVLPQPAIDHLLGVQA